MKHEISSPSGRHFPCLLVDLLLLAIKNSPIHYWKLCIRDSSYRNR